VEPLYELFIGDVTAEEQSMYSDEAHFRVVEGARLVGAIDKSGYTFDDYFRDRQEHHHEDQFILGMALFGADAPLSCASHDILHGLLRKSAYADPPEGRARALNCLYSWWEQTNMDALTGISTARRILGGGTRWAITFTRACPGSSLQGTLTACVRSAS
jgi:hypothetical protein